MKIIGIFLLFLILSASMSVLMDILMGFNLLNSIKNLLNPFYVIETGEIVMLVLFLLITIAQQIIIAKKSKDKKQKSPS